MNSSESSATASEDSIPEVQIICLTPVVNEAFELDRFLKCASRWADHIIIGYQPSIDNTLEIAKSYQKVRIINSPGTDWNELAMRSLLYEEARKISAKKRVIFNLDADELVSANFMNSPEWKSILDLPEGSIVRMNWFNFLNGTSNGFDSNNIEVAFVDDGVSVIKGNIMHMGRVPWPEYDIVIMQCQELRLLHYNYTNKERTLSKNTWYQAYEKVGKSQFGPHVFRNYNRNVETTHTLKPTLEKWTKGYGDAGIDVTSINYSYDYTHDYRLLEYLDEFGADYFRMVDIWHKDWVRFATGKKDNPQRFQDPRTSLDKLIYRYIFWSIHTNLNPIKRVAIGMIDKVLRIAGYSS